MEDNLLKDISVFDENIIKNCVLRTLKQRIWGAWQVLIGEAGIIIVRVNPKKYWVKGGKKVDEMRLK